MTSSERDEAWVSHYMRRLALLVEAYGATIFPSVGSVLIGVGSALSSGNLKWYLVGIGGVLVMGGIILAITVKPSNEQLRRTHAESASQSQQRGASLQACLLALSRGLLNSLGINDTQHRVSIYTVRGDSFALISRWSESPKLNTTGRKTFPIYEGVIGNAWEHRFTTESRLGQRREKWLAQQTEQFGIEPSVAAKLKMQSRSFAAARIDDRSKRIGVIVIESLKPEPIIDVSDAELLTKSHLFTCIKEILAHSDALFPTVHELKHPRHGDNAKGAP